MNHKDIISDKNFQIDNTRPTTKKRTRALVVAVKTQQEKNNLDLFRRSRMQLYARRLSGQRMKRRRRLINRRVKLTLIFLPESRGECVSQWDEKKRREKGERGRERKKDVLGRDPSPGKARATYGGVTRKYI